jgi:hypothetical protein
MTTLQYIADKFELDLNQKSPIEVLKINRKIMAETLAELNFTKGAEIGVAQGLHAEVLCQTIPDLLLFLVDPWRGYHGYTDYLDKRLKNFYAEAQQRLQKYNTIFIRDFSSNAVQQFDKNSLDFVYIDGAHDLWNVVNDITLWEPIVRPGGIIYGHDYKRSTNPKYQQHVVDAVNAYTYSHKVNPWFVLGERGHNDGMYKEGTRAWMWIK